jgi:hypothetical protein
LPRRLIVLLVTLLAVTAPTAAERIVSARTSHLTFVASLSPDVIPARGGRLSLSVNIIPKRRMHVYAPGSSYRAITVTLDRNPLLKASKPNYPKPSIYFFKPLKEQVPVYSDPFRLTMNVAVGTVPLRTKQLKISGTLSYQACDDRVCYLPESLPLEWTLPVRR